MNSNGPCPFTFTGTRISGWAPPGNRNFVRTRVVGSVVGVIIGLFNQKVPPCATIPICCPRVIVEARESGPHRSLRRNEDFLLYKPRSSESRKGVNRQTV